MIEEYSLWFWVVVLVLSVWDSVWKCIGLWKSARHNQLVWFVVLAVVNTVGILPIVYVRFFQPRTSDRTKKS
jgi:hypothetical protein